MPRVKNVDCAACHQRIFYEYAIHRKTFIHKLNSAKYAANGSMIYYDSVDLDKTGEHINVQSLKEHNKQADIVSNNIKKEKRKERKFIQQQQKKNAKTLHGKFEKQRQMAIKSNKHLQPKCKFNVLQTKLAYEAEMIYQQQMASFKPQHCIPCNDDDDLQDFQLTPKTAKNKCLATLVNRPKIMLTSYVPSLNDSCDIVPLLTSTQFHDSQISDIPITTAIHTPILKTTVTNIVNNTPTTTIDIQNDSITKLQDSQIIHQLSRTIKQTPTKIEDIPLPSNPQPKNTMQHHTNSYVSYFDPNATEDISFYTSFCLQPCIDNNHIYHKSPPKSPIDTLRVVQKPTETFKLRRIDFSQSDYSDSIISCRNCCVDINFKKLLMMPHLLPAGRQTFCAECLLTMISRKKDSRVDYFYRTLQ